MDGENRSGSLEQTVPAVDRFHIKRNQAGLPVVATRSGGPESIVGHETTGYLVPPNDPDTLAKFILTLAGDSVARTTLGRAGLVRAQSEFSLDRCIEAYRQLIAALAGN